MNPPRRGQAAGACVALAAAAALAGCWASRGLTGSPDADTDVPTDAIDHGAEDPAGPETWIVRAGGSGDDIPTDVIVRSDGSIVMVGCTSPGDSLEEPCTFWMATLSPSGEVMSNLVANGVVLEGVMGSPRVAALDDGGAMIASPVRPEESGDIDVWLARLDAMGSIVWQEVVGGPGDETGLDLAVRHDGGFVLAAASESFSDSRDIWIVGLGEDGSIAWQVSAGGEGSEELPRVLEDAAGNLFLSCSTTSFGSEDTDTWLIAIDPGRSMLWQLALGGPRDNYILSMAEAVDGVILAGNTDHSWYSFGGQAALVVKVGSDGVVHWQKVFNSGGNDDAAAVTVGTDGATTVAGLRSVSAYDVFRHSAWFGAIDDDGGLYGVVAFGVPEDFPERVTSIGENGDSIVLIGTVGELSVRDILLARLRTGGVIDGSCDLVAASSFDAHDSLTTWRTVDGTLHPADGTTLPCAYEMHEVELPSWRLCPE